MPKLDGHTNKIILIRGLPGSGKSTMAREMLDYRHLEADMYFEVNGEYVYDASKIKAAHDWCVDMAKECLEQGLNVVVSNTFVKNWEMQRYVDLGYPFKIIELQQRWHNIHGIPKDKIEMMAKGWQELTTSMRSGTGKHFH